MQGTIKGDGSHLIATALPKNQLMEAINFIIFIVLAGAALIWAIIYCLSKSKSNIDLKEYYEQCLNGIDKKKALEAGRVYYKSLRNNSVLTTYDEMAIANDLSTMNLTITHNS
ncbi:MAG: hypothetical protein WC716_06780 [Chitinophagaceae bacterium]